VSSIGVAMAAYRPDPAFFAEQLATIRAQTFTDWRCIITFDSPIGALRAHRLVAPLAADDRFVWVENPQRLGHMANFAKVIQAVAALGVDAIAFADQDDRWYPDKLATLAAVLGRAPALSLVHSDLDILDGARPRPVTFWRLEGRDLRNSELRHLLVYALPLGCASLMDAELARRYPTIPDGIGHDTWYAIAAAAHGGVHACPRPLLAYRQHSGNVCGVTPSPTLAWAWTRARQPGALVRSARAHWRVTAGLVTAARAAGMPLHTVDLGVLAMFGMALRNVRRDRMFAVSSGLAGLGRLLDRLG
jgi:hypothetical protein